MRWKTGVKKRKRGSGKFVGTVSVHKTFQDRGQGARGKTGTEL
jgi:hypothetical protein